MSKYAQRIQNSAQHKVRTVTMAVIPHRLSPKPDDNKCLANEPSESRPPSPPSPAHQDQILFGLQPGGHVDSHVNLLHYHFTLRCPLVMKRGLVFPDSSSLRVHLINTKRLGSVQKLIMNNSHLFSRSPYVVFSVKGNWSLNEVASLNVKKKIIPPFFCRVKHSPPK